MVGYDEMLYSSTHSTEYIARW